MLYYISAKSVNHIISADKMFTFSHNMLCIGIFCHDVHLKCWLIIPKTKKPKLFSLLKICINHTLWPTDLLGMWNIFLEIPRPALHLVLLCTPPSRPIGATRGGAFVFWDLFTLMCTVILS